MSLTSEHLERFVQRLDLLDTELARTSDHPTMLARAHLPRLTLPITDALTDLPSRRAIVGLAEREFRLTLASSTPLTLILFDVDNMEEINSRYGFDGGDAVLRQLCALLASSLFPGEFVGRFGGDSFLIVASGTNADQAVELAERASNVVRQGTFTHRDQEIRATITFGIAVAGDEIGNPLPIDDYLEGGVSDELLPMIRTALGNMEGRVPTRQPTKAELIQRIRDRLAEPQEGSRTSKTSDHLLRFHERLWYLDSILQQGGDSSTMPASAPLPTLALIVTDPVTALPNRSAILGLAEREFRDQLARSWSLALIVIDVDCMHSINRDYSHAAGDAVLTQLSGLVASSVGPDLFVGRLGGDEFLVVAIGTNAGGAMQWAEWIEKAVKKATFHFEDVEIKATVSVGVAVTDDNMADHADREDIYRFTDSQDMLTVATKRMYEAKKRLRAKSSSSDNIVVSPPDPVDKVQPPQGPCVAVTHISRYRYDAPIFLGPQIIRLLPAPACQSRILAYNIQFAPREGAAWHNTRDQARNDVVWYCLLNNTSIFEVHIFLNADLSPFDPLDFVLDRQARQYPFAYEKGEARQVAPYLSAAPAGPRLQTFLADLPTHSDNTVDFLVLINNKIHDAIKCEPRQEEGVWLPEETLANQKGASRDIAYLLVEVLRHKNLAARFVSGYFIHPGQKNDQWQVRFHAWAEVYLPGRGWLGFDPTNGLVACEAHIPLAYGIHPQDTHPIQGQCYGHANASAEFEMMADASTRDEYCLFLG